MSFETCVKNLRRFTEEIYCAIKLDNHSSVARLCLEIVSLLVKVYDDELMREDEEYDSDQEENYDQIANDGHKVRVLEEICNKLRQMSWIAGTYNELVEFVRIQDTVCLAQLLGGLMGHNGSTRSHHNEPVLKCQSLTRALRQSIILMREINIGKLNSHNDTGRTGNHFERKELIKLDGVEFSRFRLDLKRSRTELTSSTDHSERGSSLISQLRIFNDLSESKLHHHLSSNWFLEFVDEILIATYPIDRLTILVATLIVAVECQHTTAEQLFNELIDRIYHQEANSCNVEDLMQLNQVGSIWLTKRKRFMSNSRHQRRAESEVDLEGDELDRDDDESENSDSNESNSNSSSQSIESNLNMQKSNKDSPLRKYNDSRAELRKLIDDELLVGVECQICSHKPNGEWLAPLKMSSCPNCGSTLEFAYCSLSYEPIAITPVGQLLKKFPKLDELLLISSSEWANHLLGAAQQLGVSGNKTPDRLASETMEQMDINENFERLTVLRNNDSPLKQVPTNKRQTSNTDSSSSDDEETGPESGQSSDQVTTILISFMKQRIRSAQQSKIGALSFSSETIQLANFVNQDTKSLPIYSGDLLMIDSPLNDSFELKLILTQSGHPPASGRHSRTDQLMGHRSNGEQLQPGEFEPIWMCRTFSPISQVQLGCAQSFKAFELVKKCGKPVPAASQESMNCPRCDNSCKLIELRPGVS